MTTKRERIIERDGQVCNICKNFFELDNLTTDHVIPKALGGSTDIVNQRLLCLKCHKSKNSLEAKVKKLLGKIVFGDDIKSVEALNDLVVIVKERNSYIGVPQIKNQ